MPPARHPMARLLVGLLSLGFFDIAREPALAAACDTALISADTTILAGDLQFDGTELTIRGATVTIAGAHSFCRLVLEQGAVLTHAALDTTGVDVEILASMAVDPTSRVDAVGRGFGHRDGPGAPPVGTNGGGGHAGRGGDSSGANPGGSSYGSVFVPVDMGSGGGRSTGGEGGGVIHFAVSDTLELEGEIDASGNAPGLTSHGGGAGGSVHLIVGHLSGSGVIAADGGSTVVGGGGGGGRLAISSSSSSFAGSMSAIGGAGGSRGGAGTIFTSNPGLPLGDLLISNGGWPDGARTDLQEPLIAANVIVSAGAIVDGFDGTVVEGDMQVDADAHVSVDGSGHPHDQGPGAGSSTGGGGYGGAGGNGNTGTGGGEIYGSSIFPVHWGSGGGRNTGGAGGGRIHLTVHGILTLDGGMSADGLRPGLDAHGGGAGGSIRLNVGGIVGNGSISSNGGGSITGGGGGGGRIALYSPDCFAGFDIGTQVSVDGGSGIDAGETGSMFFAYDHLSAGGSEDGFLLPLETAVVSAELVAGLPGVSLVDFDEEPIGGALASTLGPVSPQAIAGTLAIRVRAGTGSGVEADRIVLGFADASGFDEQWSRYLGSTNGMADPGLSAEPWVTGLDRSFVLDLSALPLAGGGTLDLVGAMGQRGFLDCVVERNTAVDYALLSYCSGDLTGVDDEIAGLSPRPELRLRNHPNPFNPRTSISFTLLVPGPVRLEVFDPRGRQVRVLQRGRMEAGTHVLPFDAGDLPSGVYLSRLSVPGGVTSAKMTLVK